MVRWSPILLVGLIGFFSIVLVSGGVAADSFGLTPEDGFETQDRTVTDESGTDRNINSIAVAQPDDTLTVTVTAPDDGIHSLQVRDGKNPEQRLEKSIRINDGSETVTIDTSDLASGSYLLRLDSDGVTEAILPAVVPGYDITAGWVSQTESDEITISADISPTDRSGQPASVEAVAWNEETRERVTLTHHSEGYYRGSLSESPFDDDSFDVYVTALGTETLSGTDEQEILAIGVANSEVDVGPEGSDDDTDDQATEDDPDNTDSDETVDTEPSENESAVDDSETTDESDDELSVIQPNDPNNQTADEDNESAPGTTDDDTPLSPIVAFVSLLLTAVIMRHRFGRPDSQ